MNNPFSYILTAYLVTFLVLTGLIISTWRQEKVLQKLRKISEID